VNTAIAPGKNKARRVVGRVSLGKTSSYKKAFVTVGEGDSIDLYTNI
jgi:large subunit ribosomal protein L23